MKDVVRGNQSVSPFMGSYICSCFSFVSFLFLHTLSNMFFQADVTTACVEHNDVRSLVLRYYTETTSLNTLRGNALKSPL